MGWSDNVLDDYKKKKKKKESWSERVLEQKDKTPVMPTGITVKEVEEIAPVKKEEERTWFKSGAFSDGYQFGDATKTILGTVGDAGIGAVKGIGNLGEGIIDLGAYGVAGVGSLFGADTSGVKKWAKKQYVNDFLEPASEFVDRGSLLGDKADAIPEALGYVGGIVGTAGLGGLAGLGATGTTVLTTGTIGASAMGSGMGEAYRDGATDKEAVTYGLISGIAEAGTELIFGGLGKTLKVAGLSHGLSSADDVLAKKLSSKISNQVAKNFAELGVKATAEGSEEVMAGIIQSIGKKVTYMDEEELAQIIDDENLFEQFITGAVTSGIAQSGYIPGMKEGSIREANKTGRDFITGFTQNEQTVLDKVAEKKIAETEKDGTKLTSKEKNKIIEEVQEDLQKGLVDTADIESILGGETYTRLQNTKTEIEGIQKQVAELENKPNAEITVKEKEQLDGLREQLKTIDTTSIETQLQTEMKNKIGKDNFLQRSYYEKAQRSKAFVQEVTEKTSDIAKAVYGSAARVMNNTTRSHEFVETVTKIAEDRGTKYIITNNEQLKKLGYYKNVEGATINGLVNKKGEVLINIDSKNALNKIVGHETTHLLEGTNEYKVFQDTVKEYATTKGEYEARRQALTKLYEGTNADIEAELTSDLVGDYLFNDEKFVNHLSTKQPNVFKKVYDYIKHLVKQVTAGSKEARQLEKVRYRFEQAYRSVQKNGQNADTKYSMSDKKGVYKYDKNAPTNGNYVYSDSKMQEIIKANDISAIDNQKKFMRTVIERERQFGDEIWAKRFEDSLLGRDKRNREYTIKSYLKYQNQEADAKYSLSEDGKLVDDKGNDVKLEAASTGNHNSLMAIHNLSEAKLKGILELGGFPVPSIAIVDTDKFTHTNFGDISVLFDKNTIDPLDKRNTVYSRDAYTPRFPQMGYKTNEDTIRNIREMAYKHGGYDNGFLSWVLNRLDESNLSRSLAETHGNIIEAFNGNTSFKYLYLMENGIPFETVYKTKNYSEYLSNEELQNFLDEYTGDKDKLNNLSYEERTALKGRLTELYLENQVKGLNEEDAETYKKIMRADGWELDAHRIYNILLGAYQLHKYGAKKVIDESSTGENVKMATNQADYEKWLENIFGNLIEKKGIRNDKDWYTPSGTPRKFEQLYDDYNLENVVKAITRQKQAGAEKTITVGIGELSGAASKRFASIEEIREQKDALMNIEEDEFRQKLTHLDKAFRSIQSDVLETVDRSSVDAMVWTDRAYENDLLTIAQKFGEGKKITTSQIINEFAQDNFKVTEEQATTLLDLLKQTRDLPTQYFEAKPQRAVGLDEVQAIVIPYDIDRDLKKQLADTGLYVVEYDPDIEGDRQAKINQFDDLKFSLSNQNDAAPRQRGQTYSEDVKIQEVISDVEQTINNLFDRINNIYDRITVDEEDYAPVNEASLPGLEQQFTESLNTLTDDLAPVEQELDQIDEESTPNNKGITLDTKELTNEMLSLGVAKKNNTKELKKSAEELNSLITEGKTDDATLDTFVDSLGTRLLVEYDPYEYDEVMQQVRDYIRNTRLFVGGIAKKGIGQWNEFRKANLGKMKLTNDPKATPIDTAYMELQEMFGTTLFPEDIYHPADQLEHLSEVFGESKSNIPLYEYVENQYGRGAWEDIKQSFIDNIKSKVSEASKVLESQNITDYYNSIPIDDSLAPIEQTPEPVVPSVKPEKAKAKPKVAEESKIAQILTEEPKTERERNGRKWAIFKANVFDKGIVFEDVSLKHKNRELMGKWDYTLTSEARGQNAIGQGHYEYDPISKTTRQVSKSLNDIRAEVENSGLATEFYEYIYHKHNVDRMSLERKAQEKVRAILRTSEYSHEELMKLANKRITEKTSEEDVKAIEFAKEYKALFEVKNKPVFGESVTAKQSQEIVNKYELTHPEFMDFAQDIYNYTNAERQELVKSGVISQETADLWQQMYPHYVPIRRAGHEGAAINVPLDTGRTGVNAPIKKATGGNKDILPLFDTMALRTLQTYRATAKNSFGVELMNTIGTKINSQNTTVDEVLDSVDTQEELLQEGKGSQKPTFTVFEDGVKHTFEITKDMYDALKPLSESSPLSKTITPLNAASNLHRGVLTEYNPVFMLTNSIKDAQDILINSQHPAKTYVKLPEAYAQLVTKGYWYQEYMAYGGEQNSYFDSQDNTFKTENKGLKKILDIPPLSTISKLNNFIEKAPRLAEYIASRQTGRSIEVSMLDAARVTTNFKAGGNLTKFLNRNGVTFLNASVQGLMQQVRNVREAKANGARGWMNLATKFAVAGLPAVLLNSLLWDDDEEYEELSDYIKQNYYIVGKTDEGKFIRIPKGRTLAVIQEAIQQISDVATGDDEADLKAFIDLALTNLAPNSPIDNNILSPVAQVLKNKTWYGEDLVPTRLQDLPEAEQFDESTDAFSKWLGGVIDVSPIKINYLLDQYTGGVGDVILPMMTPKAESGAETLGERILAPLNNKFTADAVLNNQNVADFYDKSDELTTEAKKSNATDEDILRNKYLNSVKTEMNELYKEKREVQNSSMGNKEKYNKVRSIQTEINKLAKEGLGSYDDVEMKSNYSTVGDREYYKNTKGEWEKVEDKEKAALKDLGMTASTKNRYFKARNEISEIKNSDAENKKTPIIKAIREANLNDEQTAYLYDKHYASTEKLDVVLKTGIGMDAYLDLELQGFTADKDDEGKTINGSKKLKVFDYINELDIGFEQRVILAKMYYPSYDEYNYDIIEYLNNDDSISYDDMVEILKTLKFEVDEDGNVWWD